MSHLYMKVSKAEGLLNTCTVFTKLPVFDGCSCLGGWLQKAWTWPNPLESWVSPSRCHPWALPAGQGQVRGSLHQPPCAATVKCQLIDCASIGMELGIGTVTQPPELLDVWKHQMLAFSFAQFAAKWANWWGSASRWTKTKAHGLYSKLSTQRNIWSENCVFNIYTLQAASLCRLCVTMADKENCTVRTYSVLSVLTSSLYFQLQQCNLSWLYLFFKLDKYLLGIIQVWLF